MKKKNARNTKGKIITAAWKLFYEQGYEDTTIEDIIFESGTSKGSFYHYFDGKDALLSSLSYLFDEKYEELTAEIDPAMNSFEKLLYFNRALFSMIEGSISLDLLARLYSSQLVTKGETHLLDHNRAYFRVIRAVTVEGQERGQISKEFTVGEIVKTYALCERALLYDWCLCRGEYSLKSYAEKMLPIFLSGFRGEA